MKIKNEHLSHEQLSHHTLMKLVNRYSLLACGGMINGLNLLHFLVYPKFSHDYSKLWCKIIK